MYLTIPAAAIWAVIVLVLCALLCVGVLTRRVKRTSDRLGRELEDANATITELQGKLKTEIRDRQLAYKDLEEKSRELKGSQDIVAARNAEITRLQRLVTKAEQDATEARAERDNQINRANDESITRMNAQAGLARARMGEDPDTDTFYAQKYAVHITIGPDAETAAPVEAEPDSGAAAAPAEKEVAPAKAQAKPQTVKKPKAKR